MKLFILLVGCLYSMNLALAKPTPNKAENVNKLTKEKCNDTGKTYKICTDQLDIYNEALEKAKASDKLLLVEFGFEACPWCLALHKMFHQKENYEILRKDFIIVDIGIIPDSGKTVFNLIKPDQNLDPKKQGYPLLALVNPKTNKTLLQQTGDLEDNTNGKGHNKEKVFKALYELKKRI